ncbi:hypothetical protein HPB47_016490 [Ixodes persulcatus]|uniref:Uncharacterized protein n=1 Tax=Ixodes persulcatus TaxID=34615 RepID=A0AC60QUG4_IXOPE|nr:hypothetical protein HPB47_016490 [Ixodes persulcatus]
MEPRRASSLSDVSDLNQTVSANKRDDLCSQCIRISRHCVGKATRPYKASPEELLDYIRLIFADVFELKGEQEILQQAEGIPLPNLKLCVRILQAEGLYTAEAEPVGLDTYGLLWVDELRKVKTSVQRRTATPRWNEDILVEVNDWTKGSLTVEVWKKDPHSISNSLRSFVYSSSYRECLRALRSVLQTLCRHKDDNLIVVDAISQKGVTNQACEEIRKSAYEWHLKITVLGMPNIMDDTFVKGLADVLHPITEFHNGANVIFKQAWNESYTEITIEELDNLLDTHFRPRIVALCALIPVSKKDDKDRLVEKSLDTFYLVQGFITNALSCLPVHRPHLSMDDYLYWFGPHIAAEWFEWAQRPALTWIERFVDGDTMMPVNATDKIGSSARDTSTTIQEQFMLLWKNLNWPNPSVATKFALIVSACALLFTQKTEEKVKRQKYFEVIGDYGVSTRLCVAINNITAIVNCLEVIQRSIVECFHHDPQYDDALADLCAPVQKAADSIATSVLRLTDGVLLKIEPEITRLVENIVRCRDTSEQNRNKLVNHPAVESLAEELRLRLSCGYMTLMRMRTSEADDDVPNLDDWTLLDCCFGVPLFDNALNKDICARILDHNLCSADNLKLLVDSNRNLTQRLLQFMSDFGADPMMVDSGELPLPTQNLLFHDGKLQVWDEY